jgi:hypothetical protein
MHGYSIDLRVHDDRVEATVTSTTHEIPTQEYVERFSDHLGFLKCSGPDAALTLQLASDSALGALFADIRDSFDRDSAPAIVK